MTDTSVRKPCTIVFCNYVSLLGQVYRDAVLLHGIMSICVYAHIDS